ncbi:MAG: ATP-binding protein [Bacilli bacterium]|nr:ATP-binding protein [Bacilli bacterium]
MKHITIPAEIKSIAKAISPIIGALEDAEADFVLTNKIEVAIDEILTNISLHAYAPGSGNIDIDYSLEEDRRLFTVIITDEGVAFDPLAKEDPDVSLSEKERPIGGLGIYIVKNVMDEVTYSRVGNKNVLTLKKTI